MSEPASVSRPGSVGLQSDTIAILIGAALFAVMIWTERLRA